MATVHNTPGGGDSLAPPKKKRRDQFRASPSFPFLSEVFYSVVQPLTYLQVVKA